MRQAGRDLPGYQRIRSQTDFLSLCKNPELAAEVTLEPLETLGVDGVIIFSDILVPLEAMGLKVYFGDKGPCMENPISNRSDIDALGNPDPESDTGFVMDVIREVRNRVDGRVPVIGFAGAPWTLACYALEGSPSRTFSTAKKMVYQSPEDLHELMNRLAETVSRYLLAQVDAGAQVLQLFDSWGGVLGHGAFHEFSLKYCKQILENLEGCGVPRILFVKGCGANLESVAQLVDEVGVEAVSIDDSINPARARSVFDGRCAIQGNLPPESLFAPEEALRSKVFEVLDAFKGEPGHIFNLGHGILPKTPVSNVKAVVDAIHDYR